MSVLIVETLVLFSMYRVVRSAAVAIELSGADQALMPVGHA